MTIRNLDRLFEPSSVALIGASDRDGSVGKVVLDPDFPFAKSNMGPFNITGLPTLAIPTGFSSSGLPLSMQISGRPFDEATVLRVGHAYQRATDWHAREPDLA